MNCCDSYNFIAKFNYSSPLSNIFKRYDRRKNTMCVLWERYVRAVRTLCARRERVVNTLQQLLARSRSLMEAIKRLWDRGRCMDAVKTLCTRYNWQIRFFRRVSRRPHCALTGFKTLYKRCGIAVWCDRGLTFSTKHFQWFPPTPTPFDKVMPPVKSSPGSATKTPDSYVKHHINCP